jgi:hypothetical protein
MCGGDLNLTPDMTVAECEYCGTKQTVPTADNEKKITLFGRANRLRLACEFDKAASIYESIVAEFPEEAEAYWGLVLCKYGIEYVDDPATGKKVPTCHRSSFDSVMDDSDFEQASENADVAARKVYREEAKAIEELRKGILEVSGKEEPYDIFICYKETDESRQRTLDSVLAQDVYDALTEKGYRVFFSRISLEDKLGQEYEPYIFSALNSAKIMLVFGTDYEYFNAVWVKNEWSRFLSLIEKGAKKTLIPCFKGIDAYDMPKEFARLQSQDMGKVGAVQDLLRGIEKILGTTTKTVSAVFTSAPSAEENALIQRGNIALEDGDFKGANGYFERALDMNPSNAYAYLGKFLTSNRLRSLTELNNKLCPDLGNSKEFKRAEQFADPKLAQELKAAKDFNEVKIERAHLLDALKQGTVKKAISESLALMAQCTDEGYNQAMALLDVILSSKNIEGKYLKSIGYADTRQIAKSEFLALKFLKGNLEVCLDTMIARDASKQMSFKFEALDLLAEAGYIEKRDAGFYCWPHAEEESAKIFREAKERIKKSTEGIDAQIMKVRKEIDSEIAESHAQQESLDREISDLRTKQSSLGFFKVKEKKVLQDQIDAVQSKKDRIATQQQIEEKYLPITGQLESEKQAEIDKIHSEFHTRYPNIRYLFQKIDDFDDTSIQ